MGLIGSVLGGVTKGIGAIAAGGKYRQNLEDLQAQMAGEKEQQAFSQAVMEKGMFKGAGQSADEQAALTNTVAALRQTNKEANQNVTGGASEAAKAAAKGQTVNTIGNMMQASATKAQADRTQAYQTGQSSMQAWQNYINSTQSAINGVRNQQAQNIQAAAGAAGDAMGKLPW